MWMWSGANPQFVLIPALSTRGHFREAVRHGFVQDSGSVVDTSGLPWYKFVSHLHSALAFLV